MTESSFDSMRLFVSYPHTVESQKLVDRLWRSLEHECKPAGSELGLAERPALRKSLSRILGDAEGVLVLLDEARESPGQDIEWQMILKESLQRPGLPICWLASDKPNVEVPSFLERSPHSSWGSEGESFETSVRAALKELRRCRRG